MPPARLTATNRTGAPVRPLFVAGLARMTYLVMYADGAGSASPVLGIDALDTGLARG